MFLILVLIGVLGLAGCIFWYSYARNTASVIVGLFCITAFTAAWGTPQGNVYWLQLVASGKTGNWLVVDNSGGETLRHWILIDSYVGSSDQSDGWKFSSEDGLAYVGGDAFTLRIEMPIEEFLKTYKVRYNIPAEQTALK